MQAYTDLLYIAGPDREIFVVEAASPPMGHCKRDFCAGRLRLDGSCNQPDCTLYRAGKRHLVRDWINKTRARLGTPPKMKKPKKRMYAKMRVMTTPKTKRARSASSLGEDAQETDPAANHRVVSQSSPSTIQRNVSANVLSNGDAAGGRNAITHVDMPDVLELLALTPEMPPRRMRNLFKLNGKADTDDFSSPPSVRDLGFAISSLYENVADQIGEPRALALYSSMSGVLQSVPPQMSMSPLADWLAACFYLGWELAGSCQLEEPRIITGASEEDVKRCALRLMELMSTSES